MRILIPLTISFLFISQVILAQNQTAKKYVNVELFTNTWCGLCAFFDPAATATYEANKKDIHLTTVYPNVPYPQCPFNRANTLDNNTRKEYYGVTSTPRTFTQGTQLNSGSNLLTQSFIDSQTGQTSPLRLEVIETGLSTNKGVYVYVKSFDTPPAGDLRLFVAAVVERVNFNAQNGLTEHDNVLWQYLTNENGDPITLPSAGNSTGAFFTYNTNNLTHESFEANEVHVIAFIQNYNTKEVINSGSSKDIVIDAVVTNSTCGINNGAIDLSVRGGNGSYNVQWSNGSTNEDLSGIVNGNYAVTVSDGAGAEVNSTITVNCNMSSCNPSFNFSGSQFISEVYQVGETITSNATINANITYSAGERITLNKGFSTNNPHDFHAVIEGCN